MMGRKEEALEAWIEFGLVFLGEREEPG